MTIPMLAFIAVTVSSLGLQWQERSQRQVAIAAAALTQTANQMVTDAVNAESGVRGYAASGDLLILAPYDTARRRLPSDIAALHSAAWTPNQQASADLISTTIASDFARLAALRSSMSGVDVVSAQDVRTAIRSQKKVTDQLRAYVGALAGNADKLVSSKTAAVNRVEVTIEVVELVGLGLGLLAGLVGVALNTAWISRRLQVSVDNAERLGAGVALVPAVPSGDEVGRLVTSLARAEQLLNTRLEQMNMARDHALLATKAKNRFLSATSHELRTPLNAILGFAQLLEMSDLNDDDRDSAQRILSGGRHLLALINELIDTSVVETGELKLSTQRVPLDHLVDDVAKLMAPLATARDISIVRRPCDDLLAVYADKQRLLQVLVNLTSNAIKYNHESGTITLACCADGENKVSISVTDTGPGLRPDEIKRIFVPFERLNAAEHNIEGNGIGLPLALALTEAMHGALDVDSVVGRGSVFTVRLPRAEPQLSIVDKVALRAVTAAQANTADFQTSLTVLSIEDNAANALLLSRLFLHWPSATLHSAKTGLAGIELAVQQRPDVVLLDLHLPDLPGEEVLARLRNDVLTAHIPVIVLSADATPRSVHRLLADGVNGYLTKPVDLRELQELISEVVKTKESSSTGD